MALPVQTFLSAVASREPIKAWGKPPKCITWNMSVVPLANVVKHPHPPPNLRLPPIQHKPIQDKPIQDKPIQAAAHTA